MTTNQDNNLTVNQATREPVIARGVIRWLIRTLIFALFITAALFLPSGRLDWVMGWAYVGAFVVSQLITMLTLLRTSPDLLIERADIQEGTKDWDRVLARLVALVGPLAMWIVAGLEARFRWAPEIPLWLQITGLVLVILGSLVTTWAMAANRYFSGTVRIQEDRGQTVATGGPYRYVRHPGYVGAILYDVGTPLSLSSLWTFIPALVTVCLVVLRTALEDKTLIEELDGYPEYARRVRYRLLPGIW